MLAEQAMLDVEKVTEENAVGKQYRQEKSIKVLQNLRDRQCMQSPEIGPSDTYGGFNPRLQMLGGPDFPNWKRVMI